MNESKFPLPPDDDALDRLLKESQVRRSPGDLAMTRIYPAVHAAWLSATGARRSERRRRWYAAMAAGLAACVLAAGWVLLRPAAVFGVFQLPVAGQLLVSRSGQAAARPSLDPTVHVGDRVTARTNMLLGLKSGSILRLKAGSELEISKLSEVRLLAGTVYVDITTRPGSSQLQVRTPAGVVQHLGTQFEVSLVGDATRVRVREGAVRFGDSRQVGAGEELTVTADGAAHRTLLVPYDHEWDWVRSPPSDLVVEGRNLGFLLRWVARETGRRLEFADERTSAMAEGTVLHGSVSHLEPELALRAMLASTTLEADVRVDRIVVHTGSTTDTP